MAKVSKADVTKAAARLIFSGVLLAWVLVVYALIAG